MARVVLLINTQRQTLILTRQFRFPAFVNGLKEGMLLEACAGLLDSEDPEEAIRREVEEETGFRIGPPQKLFELYMSPGSVTEKLFFFIAEYHPSNRVSSGGGDQAEGEDTEIVELSFNQAFSMIASPTNLEFCQARTMIARTSSNTPETRINAHRRGTNGGIISAIASVLTKCPSAAKAKTKASPNRPAQSTSPPTARVTRAGTIKRPAIIAICFNVCLDGTLCVANFFSCFHS
jgi:nudix-type nucleoside diphosphatase (YffH/AdpP family)